MRRARPPTRVSNACDRCRRQKQRCDDDRPCSNCEHARTECKTSDRPVTLKRPRISTQLQLQEPTSIQHRISANVAPPRSVTKDNGNTSLQYDSSTNSTGHTNQHERDQCSSCVSGDQSEPRPEQMFLTDLRGSESVIGITKKFFNYASSPVGRRETFAIPGSDFNRPLDSAATYERLVPISEVLGTEFPPRDLCDALMDTYFFTVHWFSLVIYEPKFRPRYNAIMDRGLASPSDRPFLLLLSMIIIMACWYGPTVLPPETVLTFDLVGTRKQFLQVVSQSYMDLIDENCLEFVQLSALLGSYWLYWGRPRSSFSILGAATKSAQAMELHRDSDNRRSFEDTEERKRIWWTIYTWDRFATIIYGRPLGVNDKDCNVSMPASFPEDISFSPQAGPIRVCVSTYQIHLNDIYRITAPLLENIYGIRYSHNRSLHSQMPAMITKIDQLMQAWQDNLPPHLHLEKNDDICLASPVEEKMHRLQALSLQLTYDNLMIVIHRPLLADQGYRRSRTRIPHLPRASDLPGKDAPIHEMRATNDISFRQCLNAALRISNIQQGKRNLLALARGTHLVSFLGMNLFTSSVVLFICALSDILSDTAQEAKRGMARNLKLLKLLSGDGSLSMQCSVILEDLVQQIVDREKEEMLCSLPTDDEVAAFITTRRNSYIVSHPAANYTVTDLEASRQPNDVPNQSQDIWNERLNGNSGSAVYRAMASLQEVFKDNATLRVPANTANLGSDRTNQQYFQHRHTQQSEQEYPRYEYSGFTFDGSNFNTEDLGQFWLWNLEPYPDESVASLQSGDENIN